MMILPYQRVRLEDERKKKIWAWESVLQITFSLVAQSCLTLVCGFFNFRDLRLEK